MNSYRFYDLREGLCHSFQVTVTPAMVDAFTSLTGDHHPLHCDPSFAAGYGFADRVVHGMLTASFLSTLVGMYLPGRFAYCQEVALALTAPVFPGDTLTVTGKVVALDARFRQVELKAQICNQHGQKVTRATIRTGVRE